MSVAVTMLFIGVFAEPVYGKVFGCGAGASPTGYGVNRITDSGVASTDGVFSAAIMAGFLGATAPRSALRNDILNIRMKKRNCEDYQLSHSLKSFNVSALESEREPQEATTVGFRDRRAVDKN